MKRKIDWDSTLYWAVIAFCIYGTAYVLICGSGPQRGDRGGGPTMLDGLDPRQWVEAASQAVEMLPYGREFFLALAVGVILRVCLPPLLGLLRRR